MKKVIFTILVFFLTGFSIFAQSNRTTIYNAFISGDMEKWKTMMTEIEKKSPTSVSGKLELISYYYGYIGYSLGVKNKKQAQIYVDKGDDLLTELAKSNTENADVFAFKAAFIGFKIGISPYKAPFIGKSSIDNGKKALSLDKDNIQANIEQANILYYSPSAFGGDKTKARTYYQKAISLFEANPAELKQNWLYLSLLTQIAQMQTSEGKYTDAKKTYDKVLNIEPNYLYVKDELLPALKKKM